MPTTGSRMVRARTTALGSSSSRWRSMVASGVSAPRNEIRQRRGASGRKGAEAGRAVRPTGTQARLRLRARPSASETEQPAADEVAREVLLGDGDRARFPASPTARKVGATTSSTTASTESDASALSSSSCAARRRRLAARLRAPPRCPLAQRRSAEPAVRRLEGASCCLGSRQAVGEVVGHAPDSPFVVVRVETKAAAGAGGLEQPISPLPGSQQVRGHTGATCELADAQVAGWSRFVHRRA